MWFKNKKHNNYEWEYKMCKTNMKTNVYYVNICKREHDEVMVQDCV